jgi:hypothetical protein
VGLDQASQQDGSEFLDLKLVLVEQVGYRNFTSYGLDRHPLGSRNVGHISIQAI